MRIVFLLVASVAIGLAVGVSVAHRMVGQSQSVETIATLRGEGVSEAVYPIFEIDATTFQFGTMERGSTREHSFKVTNSGTGPLNVKVDKTSCKCTVGDIPGEPILPGETVEVKLSWVAKSVPGLFRQTATLLTSDPRSASIELTIEGNVTEVRGIEPQQWHFDRINAGDQSTQRLYVMSFREDDLKVLSAEVEDPEARKWFTVQIVPMDKSELPNPDAQSGVRIDVTAEPGLPLGGIYEWVVLKTNLPAKSEFATIPIQGTVVGDMHFRGPSVWNERANALFLGDVQSSEGKAVTLFLSVKGKHAESLEVEGVEGDPEELEVEVGEKKMLRPGVAHIPLTVRLPPGLPSVIRNGTKQGKAGHVVLKTNHPLSPEIGFDVRYIIRRSSVTP